MDKYLESQLRKRIDDLYNQLNIYTLRLKMIVGHKESIENKINEIQKDIRDASGELEELLMSAERNNEDKKIMNFIKSQYGHSGDVTIDNMNDTYYNGDEEEREM